MKFLFVYGCCCITLLPIIYTLSLKELAIIIISQPNSYHLNLAENLKKNLHYQLDDLLFSNVTLNVYLSHLDFHHSGHWTIIPLIPKLYKKYRFKWYTFVEDYTEINLKNLLNTLNKYDYKKKYFIGHALYDEEPTIIHHFAFNENGETFKYPNLKSGIALSHGIIKSLNDRLHGDNYTKLNNFNIDSAYELAVFIWNDSHGTELQNELKFCLKKDENCAIYPLPFKQCGWSIVSNKAVYYAVKTCKKFHNNRVVVVKKTWGQYVFNIKYFSDFKDNLIPTINLGIANTESGHCAKTMAILKYVWNEIKNNDKIQWLILVDDDTILGVHKMQQLLSCYDPFEFIVLGERYGYNVYNIYGYNYITGGGGIVFSRKSLKILSTTKVCKCPSIDAPDDMYLGICIRNLGYHITHSIYFHQARPIDYNMDYFNYNQAVTFHKHWMIDPIRIYNNWFNNDSKQISISDYYNNEL